MITDRQTHTHTHTYRLAHHNTPLPYRGRISEKLLILLQFLTAGVRLCILCVVSDCLTGDPQNVALDCGPTLPQNLEAATA